MKKKISVLYELNKDIKLISYNEETKKIIYRGIRTGILRRGILGYTLKLPNGKLALGIEPLEIIEEKNNIKKKKKKEPGQKTPGI